VRERKFRRCDGIARGGVHNHNALFGCSGNIDIVDAYASATDRLELFGARQNIGGDFSFRADDNRFGVFDKLLNLVWSGAVGFDYIEALLFEEFDPLRRNGVCHEYFLIIHIVNFNRGTVFQLD